ncbi:unnamed protein product [Penicillium egyptiacum]|uniref:Cofilin n=1 Tax=Penicillium egyptiacum TaxID=1303716 RepID=A0A9W4KF82_9EURO|nr:unnamed protein product [Penicillium egyptiacum]
MEMHIRRPAQTQALAIPEIAQQIRKSRSLQKALFFIPASENSRKVTRVYNPMLAPAFHSAFPSEDLRDAGHASDKIEGVRLSDFDLTKSPAKREMYLRPEASWRRMLTQQPPVFTVGLFSMVRGPMGLSWYQERATRQDEGLRMGALFDWFIHLGRDQWNSGSIAICLGGAEPVNTPLDIKRSCTSLFTDGINEDWRATTASFDLVLMTRSGSTYMEPKGPDDPDWVKGRDEIVWEEICETSCELGLTVAELKMEAYNEGFAGFHLAFHSSYLTSKWQASSARVNDECVATFEKLKLDREFSYITYALSEDHSEIIVDKTSDNRNYEALVNDLPSTECRWVVDFFQYEIDGRKGTQLILICW